MATITGLTATRMLEIEAASVVSGTVVGDNLILTKHDSTTINAGNVRGPAGPTGPGGSDPNAVKITNVDQSVDGVKSFVKVIASTLPADGVGISIVRAAASMGGGSLIIGRTASNKPHSIVFGGAGIAMNMIIGREASSDHLVWGYDGGAGFVKIGQLGTGGTVEAIGALSNFGPGAFGDNDTYLKIGKFDGSYCQIKAGQGVSADAHILIESKGAGTILLRNGNDPTHNLVLNATGQVNISTGAAAFNGYGLYIGTSPNAVYAAIEVQSNWGVGGGSNQITFKNSSGTIFNIDCNGELEWHAGANLAGIFTAGATAGAGAAVPATVAGFLAFKKSGTQYKIPYFDN